jgi:hypothetical protein
MLKKSFKKDGILHFFQPCHTKQSIEIEIKTGIEIEEETETEIETKEEIGTEIEPRIWIKKGTEIQIESPKDTNIEELTTTKNEAEPIQREIKTIHSVDLEVCK